MPGKCAWGWLRGEFSLGWGLGALNCSEGSELLWGFLLLPLRAGVSREETPGRF